MDEQVKDQNELQATDSEPAPGQIQKENISQHFMQHATAIQMSLHVSGLYTANASLLDYYEGALDLWKRQAVPAQVEPPAASAASSCFMLGSVRLGRKDWADVAVTTLCRLTGHCQCASGPSPDLTGNCIKAVLSDPAFRAGLSLPPVRKLKY
ncbi:MAG: hypothetical protein FRX49_01647 [Trebouxia sp. A1-2]|nr:MAG: hypothetical protein FRX49_01647 [Trebouxia sp. A1-2]